MAVAEEIHSIEVPFDENAGRVCQIQAEFRTADRKGSKERVASGDSRLVDAGSGDLRCRADFRGAIEKVELDGDTKMTAFPADDVELIAGGDLKDVEIAVDDRTCGNRIAVPDDVAAQGGGLGAPKWDNHYEEVIFAGEFPVYLSGEGGVVAEVKCIVEGYRNRIALGLDTPCGARVKPIEVEPEFIRVEVFCLLSLHVGNDQHENQNGDSQWGAYARPN